ncbi:tetratricopeptide repeat protein [Myxococcus faecalis]|uniref:tetratricopeptide repeat protein n=1 Tax=Myxococcus faecalis TaxID=3115646 RepID=UPI003CF401FD
MGEGTCPDEAELADLVQGLVSGDALASLERHLDGCGLCRRVVVVLAGGEARAESVAASADAGMPRLERGARVGHYEVLEHVGLGAMGVVFAANDPRLHRKVALKLLRSDWVKEGGAEDARERLWREARALARLSHPHVVAVHDVGVHGESLFIAMDFVEGTTLRRWLRAEPRRWTEVLGRFLQAGEGLAAAHARGLVHRDFKPDNVLVGVDGRVRVTDFGLARLTQTSLPGGVESAVLDGASSGDAGTVTQPGALLGTPAYMAPEQLEGRPADARSDQFSFCVALHEGLYGRRPFEASSRAALVQAIRAGPPVSSGEARVPARIRRAVLRGLSADPTARHPSMEALLAALTHRPRWERWRMAAVWAGAATLAGVGAGFWLRETTRCAGADGHLVGVWDSALRGQLEAVFTASGLPLAQEGFGATARRLDAYAEAIARMERDSCEATHVRGEQSGRMLDLRGMCLDRRREALRASVTLMLQGDAAVLERAPQAAHALPDLLPCADREALASVVPLPEDPVVRQRLQGLQARLAEGMALQEAGQHARARQVAEEVLQAVRQTGYRPMEASALFLLGLVEKAHARFTEAAEVFDAAQLAALAGRDDDLMVRALMGLADSELQGHARYAEAERAVRLAEATLERLDIRQAPGAAGELHLFRGHLFHRKGEAVRAQEDFRRALELFEQAHGPESPRLDAPLTALGLILNLQGHYEEARGYYERALELQQRAYGREHPVCVSHLNNVATALRLQGRVEEAVARYEEALSLGERRLGAAHSSTNMVRVNLGDALQLQGRLTEALARYEEAMPALLAVHGDTHPRVASVLTSMGTAYADLGESRLAQKSYGEALAVQRRLLGPEHPDLALTYNNLASVMLDLGEPGKARPLLQLARGLWEKSLGPEHPRVASVLQNLAKADLAEGRLGAAHAGFERALAMRRKGLGPEHPKLVSTLTLLAEAKRRLEGPRAALATLQEAVLLAGKAQVTPADRAKALFWLARATWDSDGSREQARTLARQAEEALRKAPRTTEALAREVRQWRARHDASTSQRATGEARRP